MGPLHLQLLLLLPSPVPIIFLRGAADVPGWAHCTFSAASADGFAWAHYFSEKCCRCHWMGPLHFQQLLLMASPGPIIFVRDAVDIPRWAHCAFSSCCQWLHLGPLLL